MDFIRNVVHTYNQIGELKRFFTENTYIKRKHLSIILYENQDLSQSKK